MILNGVTEGSGPDIVLLHPVGLDRTFWGAAASMSGSGYRMTSLDLRGHGDSGAAERRPPIGVYADDVLETMRAFSISRAVVLGLSFGGMVAQELALRGPESVAGLILAACPPGVADSARENMRQRGLVAERDGMAAIVATTISRWFTESFVADLSVERVRQRLLRDRPERWSDGWHAIAEFDALPRLHSIKVPTLVVAGERDMAMGRHGSDTLAGAISGAKLAVIPAAPHMMQIETPGPFWRQVSVFLAQNG